MFTAYVIEVKYSKFLPGWCGYPHVLFMIHAESLSRYAQTVLWPSGVALGSVGETGETVCSLRCRTQRGKKKHRFSEKKRLLCDLLKRAAEIIPLSSWHPAGIEPNDLKTKDCQTVHRFEFC